MAIVKPIQLNPDLVTRKKIEEQAKKENRKLGPMALEMIRRYIASLNAA